MKKHHRKMLEEHLPQKIEEIVASLNLVCENFNDSFDLFCQELTENSDKLSFTIKTTNKKLQALLYGKNAGNELATLGSIELVELLARYADRFLEFYDYFYDKIAEAMVLVQNQDIIRQNILNLGNCLALVNAKRVAMASGEDTAVLKFLDFTSKDFAIASALLENIVTSYSQFEKETLKVLTEIATLSKTLQKDVKYLSRFLAAKRGGEIQDLNKAGEEVCLALKHLEVCIAEVSGNMGVLKERFSRRGLFSTRFKNVKTEINLLKKQIEHEKELCYKETGFSGESFSQKETELLLSQFTCMLERKTARRLLDQEEEEESSGSNMVLF